MDAELVNIYNKWQCQVDGVDDAEAVLNDWRFTQPVELLLGPPNSMPLGQLLATQGFIGVRIDEPLLEEDFLYNIDLVGGLGRSWEW